MWRGAVDQHRIQIITVDITDLNSALHALPGVSKIVGDANGEAVVKTVAVAFGDKPIDLLYVDAAHDFLPTITNLGLYVLILRPRFVLIDDIVLNEGMRTLWQTLCLSHGARAINCVDVVPEVRSAKIGFGLLQLR
jgi:hypothetical protein